jgi:hypothetical protein
MHAAAFPLGLDRTTLPVSLVALFAGVVLAAGVIGLADSDQLPNRPTKLIVVDAPAPPSQGVGAKDEAGVASAIALGPQLRGSKASAITASGPATPQADDSGPVSPRGLASTLSNR